MAGQVEFVGGGEFGEVPAELRTGRVESAGETVPEDPVGLREPRIRGLPVARPVEIHDPLRLRADHLGEFGAARVHRQQGGGETVGAVAGVAQARELEGRAGAPCGEAVPDALEVGDESAARVRDVRGAEPEQQLYGRISSTNTPGGVTS